MSGYCSDCEIPDESMSEDTCAECRLLEVRGRQRAEELLKSTIAQLKRTQDERDKLIDERKAMRDMEKR